MGDCFNVFFKYPLTEKNVRPLEAVAILSFRAKGVTRTATRDAQERERHAYQKRNNPTDESGALLKMKGAMLILSASSYAALPWREQRNSMNLR